MKDDISGGHTPNIGIYQTAPDGKRKVITMSAQEVANELGTDPMKIKSAILNGTMPIGLVAKADTSTKDRTIIIRRRYELWLSGELRA